MKYLSRKITLQDYSVMASIGIHEHELVKKQRLLISVDVHLSYGVNTTDDISSVINYDFLRVEIKKTVDSRHYNLQETLCHDIVELIGKHGGVSRVLVSTRKPDVYDDCLSVGYTAEAEFP